MRQQITLAINQIGMSYYKLGKRIRGKVIIFLIVMPIGVPLMALKYEPPPSVLILTIILVFFINFVEKYVKYIVIDEVNGKICINYFILLFRFRTYCRDIEKVDIYIRQDSIEILSREDNKLHIIELGEDCDKQTFYALWTHLEKIIIERKGKAVGGKKRGSGNAKGH